MEYLKRNKVYLFVGKPLQHLPTDRLPTNSEILRHYFWNRDVLNQKKLADDTTLYSLINTCQLLDIHHSEFKNLKRKFHSKEGLLHRYEHARISSYKKSQPDSSFQFVQWLDNEYDCTFKGNPTTSRRLAGQARLEQQRQKEAERKANEIVYNYCPPDEEDLDESSLMFEDACAFAEELVDPTFRPRIREEFKSQIKIISPELIDSLNRVRLSGKFAFY